MFFWVICTGRRGKDSFFLSEDTLVTVLTVILEYGWRYSHLSNTACLGCALILAVNLDDHLIPVCSSQLCFCIHVFHVYIG